MTPEEKKQASNKYSKAKRLRDKGIKTKCDICGREYQKGRLYEHKQTKFHTIAVLREKLEDLTKKN